MVYPVLQWISMIEGWLADRRRGRFWVPNIYLLSIGFSIVMQVICKSVMQVICKSVAALVRAQEPLVNLRNQPNHASMPAPVRALIGRIVAAALTSRIFAM